MDSSLVFTNGAWDTNYTHNHAKNNKFAEFAKNTKVELTVSLNLNFVSTIYNILTTLGTAVHGTVMPTTAGGFLIRNSNLFVDGTIADPSSPFDAITRAVSLNVSGEAEDVEKFYRKVEKYIKTDEIYVHWWFKSKNELSSVRFTLEDSKVFRKEHYPFIPDADQFVKNFIDSPANILILLGEPGTGKTSFIRHLLRVAGDECFITYDESVMMEDQLYTTFLTTKEARFLILEDADLIMTDRQRDGNKVMSKLLNAADGLVSFQKKKIVFTANIRDINKIDSALMRPGRCFGVVNFRALHTEEAQGVADIHGINLPAPRSYTLAEIFN